MDMASAVLVTGLCMYVSWTDLRDRRIPNCALLACLFLLVALRLAFSPGWPWLAHALTGGAFFVLFGCIAWFWPRAIGMGDVKMIALLGFALGLRALVFILTTACLGALLVALLLVCSRRAALGSALPFAPFLCGAVLLFVITCPPAT